MKLSELKKKILELEKSVVDDDPSIYISTTDEQYHSIMHVGKSPGKDFIEIFVFGI